MKKIVCRIGLRGATALIAACAGIAYPGVTNCPAQEREVAAAYIEGIESLETGDFNKAAGDFDKAIASDDSNADYFRARGVANTLAEKFPAAIADLQRAFKLRPDDHEAKLWLAAAYMMSGDSANGSQYFTTNGVPPNYANMIYNIMARDYWSSRTVGNYYDYEQRRLVETKTTVKTLFPDAAKAYAGRHKAAGAGANKLVAERMKAALARGDWTAAWKDLVVLRRTVPGDVPLRADAATCLLGFGDALHARAEFTHVLCIDPLWGEGYLGRAQAAAAIGDIRRANADLDTAESLGVKAGDVQKKIRGLAKTAPAGGAVEAFAQKVNAGAAWDETVDAALALHRWFNNRRLRYDEDYQDRIFAVSDAIRAKGKDPDRHEMLARFLHNNHIVPAIWNGPRAVEQLRPQSAAEHDAELDRAMASADEALTIDPRHVNALVTKGLIYLTCGNQNAAEKAADQALEIEPRNVRALLLKIRILLDRADQLNAQAAALRAGRTERHRETRSDGEYEVSTYYPPTAEELARAARCDAEAAELRKKAAGLQAGADKVRNEVVPALLKKGKADKAAALDADRDDVNRGLAEMARKRGDAKAQRMYALMAEPLQHTTAAEQLKTAWEHIGLTDWKNSTELLDAAAAIDPADARVPAYRGVIAAGRQDAAGAARQRTAALALEEARARLMGTSFVAANNTPLWLDELGLTIVVRRQQGDAFAAEKRGGEALAAFAANMAIEKRAAGDDLWTLLPTAMLPDPAAEQNATPAAPSLASLMAWSRLGSARALLALNRPAEAQAEFRAIRLYLANWPATAKDRETMNVVDAWARLGIAEAAVANKDNDAASRELISGEGWPWGLPKELEARKNALIEEFRAGRNRIEEEQMEAQRRMTPDQRREQMRQADMDQFQSQRDQTLRALQDPNLSAADRRALESSLKELDRMTEMQKKGSRRSR
ncbi:MAG TPA: hypothetical protein P5287_00440 [bacterium]|nr:hypothetical protein [bacterium]